MKVKEIIEILEIEAEKLISQLDNVGIEADLDTEIPNDVIKKLSKLYKKDIKPIKAKKPVESEEQPTKPTKPEKPAEGKKEAEKGAARLCGAFVFWSCLTKVREPDGRSARNMSVRHASSASDTC